MSYLVGFLAWFGFGVESWPNWGILLFTLGLIVASILLLLISWILTGRATRAGWQTQSETSQAKSRAFNDALTASRLSHERAKAEATQAADLARIRNESQLVIEGPQREIAALRKAVEEHRAAIAERDASFVSLRDERDQANAIIAQMKDRMAIGEQARAVMLGDADDHRNERQQLLAENGAVRQQLGQAQAEIERLHSSLRESLTHQKS